LGNEARNTARSNNTRHQNNTIQNSAHEIHEHLTKKIKHK
jgi:hypothetical protein